MLRIAARPKILKTKIELVNLMRKKMPTVKVDKSPVHSYYWSATFHVNDQSYYVYVQHFTGRLRRMQVQYVHIRKMPGQIALSVKEIKELLTVVQAM